MRVLLTLAELEALSSAGTSRLFTLHLSRVAGEQPARLEHRTKSLLVYLAQRAGNGEAQRSGLPRDAAAIEVYLNIVFAFVAREHQGLRNHILQNSRREVVCQLAVVDGNFSASYA